MSESVLHMPRSLKQTAGVTSCSWTTILVMEKCHIEICFDSLILYIDMTVRLTALIRRLIFSNLTSAFLFPDITGTLLLTPKEEYVINKARAIFLFE